MNVNFNKYSNVSFLTVVCTVFIASKNHIQVLNRSSKAGAALVKTIASITLTITVWILARLLAHVYCQLISGQTHEFICDASTSESEQFDDVMTKFTINNRTDAWKTDVYLLHRHNCFIGKYITRKIHTKPHPGLGKWSEIFGKSSKSVSSVCLYNKKNITR